MPANQDIIDDVRELRNQLPKPKGRQYTLGAKRDTIRVTWDDDVTLAGNRRIHNELAERGYVHVGTNFDSKMLAYEKDD